MKLRALQDRDAEAMYGWMTDPACNQYFQFEAASVTMDSVLTFIRGSAGDSVNKHYAIADKADEYCGTISLKNISSEHRNAEYAIALCSSCIGKGMGSWATGAILDIAFDKLKLHKVYLNVYSDNTRAIQLYEKSGFVYEGEFKDHIYTKDGWKSLMWFRILRSEYQNGGKN